MIFVEVAHRPCRRVCCCLKGQAELHECIFLPVKALKHMNQNLHTPVTLLYASAAHASISCSNCPSIVPSKNLLHAQCLRHSVNSRKKCQATESVEGTGCKFEDH